MLKHTLAISALLASTGALAQSDDETKNFTMNGEFGLIITTGNTETTSVTAGITAKQEFDNWQNDYIIEGLYREETVIEEMIEESRVSARQFFSSAQTNYKLENPNHRLFGFASYENDRFGPFKTQATLAAGWSQKLLENKTHAFEYSIGPGYAWQTAQDDSTNGDVDTFIVRASAAYTWFISDTAKFTNTLATEVGSENTKSRADLALSAKISGSLSMQVSIQLDHNTQVDPSREKLDTQSAVTLVYTFF